jgi:hypothetical protein
VWHCEIIARGLGADGENHDQNQAEYPSCLKERGARLFPTRPFEARWVVVDTVAPMLKMCGVQFMITIGERLAMDHRSPEIGNEHPDSASQVMEEPYGCTSRGRHS